MAILKKKRDSGHSDKQRGGVQESLAALDEEWRSLQETALVTHLRPGSPTWLELTAALDLPASAPNHLAVAVAPGRNWGKEFDHFAVELVRVMQSPSSGAEIILDRARTRVFRYDRPFELKMLREMSPWNSDRPCIEEVRKDGRSV